MKHFCKWILAVLALITATALLTNGLALIIKRLNGYDPINPADWLISMIAIASLMHSLRFKRRNPRRRVHIRSKLLRDVLIAAGAKDATK